MFACKVHFYNQKYWFLHWKGHILPFQLVNLRNFEKSSDFWPKITRNFTGWPGPTRPEMIVEIGWPDPSRPEGTANYPTRPAGQNFLTRHTPSEKNLKLSFSYKLCMHVGEAKILHLLSFKTFFFVTFLYMLSIITSISKSLAAYVALISNFSSMNSFMVSECR